MKPSFFEATSTELGSNSRAPGHGAWRGLEWRELRAWALLAVTGLGASPEASPSAALAGAGWRCKALRGLALPRPWPRRGGRGAATHSLAISGSGRTGRTGRAEPKPSRSPAEPNQPHCLTLISQATAAEGPEPGTRWGGAGGVRGALCPVLISMPQEAWTARLGQGPRVDGKVCYFSEFPQNSSILCHSLDRFPVGFRQSVGPCGRGQRPLEWTRHALTPVSVIAPQPHCLGPQPRPQPRPQRAVGSSAVSEVEEGTRQGVR